MSGRFCAMLQGNTNWKFLLDLPGMTDCSFPSLSICTDLSFQECRKAFQASWQLPVSQRGLNISCKQLCCCERLRAAPLEWGEAWAEPLTWCIQSHFSLNQPCQSQGEISPSPSLHLLHPSLHSFFYSTSCSSIRRRRWMQAPDYSGGGKLSPTESLPRKMINHILQELFWPPSWGFSKPRDFSRDIRSLV